jgi:dipeptidyl aminopeptidase/acylaminoacyl peptidase
MGPFPLVVYLHGSPWFGLEVGAQGDSAFWTSRGAALLQSGYAASGILGEDMMWEPLRSVGMPERDLDADGVIDGVEQLVRTGVADVDRVYAYGFSAGAYLVNRMVTRRHPFAAAACWDGPADVRAFTGETREIQIFFRGCTPEECPERWEGASPASRPEAVTIPFMIISAGRSAIREDAAAWHAALTRAGADSTLHVFPDEDHVFGPEAHHSALVRLAEAWQLP